MYCSKCNRKMKNVLHFEPNREYQFNLCVYCRKRSKMKRIHFDDLLSTNTGNNYTQRREKCI